MLEPHILGSAFVARFMISRTAQQSSRRLLLEIPSRNLWTLPSVRLVLSSAITNLRRRSSARYLLPPPPLHQLRHQVLAGPLRRLGVEVGHQPVPEHRRRHRLHVVE